MDLLTRTRISKINQLSTEALRGTSTHDERHSLNRALHGLQSGELQRLAPYESDCSDRIAEKVGRPPRPGHVFVPVHQRDLTVASGPGGGFLVQNNVGPGNLFLHYLHAALGMILQWLSHLTMQGSASIPSVSGTVSTGWLSTESTQLTESQIQFAVAGSTPKSVGAYVEASRTLLVSTSAFAQDYLMRILAQAVAAEEFAKLISGSGAAGQIQGILNTSGIGAISGASLAYSTILDALKTVEELSAMVNPTNTGFVLAPTEARLARIREKVAGSGTIMTANDLAGYPAVVTKAIPDGSAIFGDWSQLLLLEWGILEVGTDPYGVNSNLFKSGLVGIRAIWTVDAVVLQPKSFVKITGIT